MLQKGTRTKKRVQGTTGLPRQLYLGLMETTAVLYWDPTTPCRVLKGGRYLGNLREA